MSCFAQIDENNVVVNIIAADQEFIDGGHVGDPTSWIECSMTGEIRGRYPGVGYIYNAELDEFMLPKPEKFPSWIWDTNSGVWTPPIPFPGSREESTLFDWDEENGQWVEKNVADFLNEIEQKISDYNSSANKDDFIVDPTKTY